MIFAFDMIERNEIWKEYIEAEEEGEWELTVRSRLWRQQQDSGLTCCRKNWWLCQTLYCCCRGDGEILRLFLHVLLKKYQRTIICRTINQDRWKIRTE
jgi:hypothetical protein